MQYIYILLFVFISGAFSQMDFCEEFTVCDYDEAQLLSISLREYIYINSKCNISGGCHYNMYTCSNSSNYYIKTGNYGVNYDKYLSAYYITCWNSQTIFLNYSETIISEIGCIGINGIGNPNDYCEIMFYSSMNPFISSSPLITPTPVIASNIPLYERDVFDIFIIIAFISLILCVCCVIIMCKKCKKKPNDFYERLA